MWSSVSWGEANEEIGGVSDFFNGLIDEVRISAELRCNGATTLFAALNVLDDTVVARCMQRHRHQELLRVLNAASGTLRRARSST